MAVTRYGELAPTAVQGVQQRRQQAVQTATDTRGQFLQREQMQTNAAQQTAARQSQEKMQGQQITSAEKMQGADIQNQQLMQQRQIQAQQQQTAQSVAQQELDRQLSERMARADRELSTWQTQVQDSLARDRMEQDANYRQAALEASLEIDSLRLEYEAQRDWMQAKVAIGVSQAQAKTDVWMAKMQAQQLRSSQNVLDNKDMMDTQRAQIKGAFDSLETGLAPTKGDFVSIQTISGDERRQRIRQGIIGGMGGERSASVDIQTHGETISQEFTGRFIEEINGVWNQTLGSDKGIYFSAPDLQKRIAEGIKSGKLSTNDLTNIMLLNEETLGAINKAYGTDIADLDMLFAQEMQGDGLAKVLSKHPEGVPGLISTLKKQVSKGMSQRKTGLARKQLQVSNAIKGLMDSSDPDVKNAVAAARQRYLGLTPDNIFGALDPQLDIDEALENMGFSIDDVLNFNDYLQSRMAEIGNKARQTTRRR